MRLFHTGLVSCVAIVATFAGFQPILAEDGDPASVATQIEGTWMPESYSPRLLTIGGETPPLTAEAAALYRDRTAQADDPDRQYDRTRWCAGAGIPRIMLLPYPFEIRADGNYLGFIHGWYRWHRMVDMSGEPVDPILWQTMGYPVGRWLPDGVVIDTVGISSETVLDEFGLPHSDEMQLTERLRPLEDGTLEVTFTITDPEFYTKPWETVMTYRRVDEIVGDDVCPDRLVTGEPAVRRALP